jgi:hypothetical protein
VKRLILIGGLAVGAFLVTLAFSSWHEGLWQSATQPSPAAAPELKDHVVVTGPAVAPPAEPSSEAKISMPPEPAAPVRVSPPVGIAPDEAPQGQPQYQQYANPGVDSEAIRRDRGIQHTSGSQR